MVTSSMSKFFIVWDYANGEIQVDEVNARDSLFQTQAEAEAAIPVGFSTVTINASTGGSGGVASVNPDIPF